LQQVGFIALAGAGSIVKKEYLHRFTWYSWMQNGRINNILERTRRLSLDILSVEQPVCSVIALRNGATAKLVLGRGDVVSWKPHPAATLSEARALSRRPACRWRVGLAAAMQDGTLNGAAIGVGAASAAGSRRSRLGRGADRHRPVRPWRRRRPGAGNASGEQYTQHGRTHKRHGQPDLDLLAQRYPQSVSATSDPLRCRSAW